MTFSRDVVIVGGCGHVGLPLGLAFADRGLSVALYDIDEAAVSMVNSGRLPFDEPGALAVLPRVLEGGFLATTDASVVTTAEAVVVVVGTPVGGHLAPDPQAMARVIETLGDRLLDGQLLVLRSTVYPGVTALVERVHLPLRQAVAPWGRKTPSFCKDRERLRQRVVFLQAFSHVARPHMSLRQPLPLHERTRHGAICPRWRECPPALAAGLTDHVWTFRELLTAKFEPREFQSISQ